MRCPSRCLLPTLDLAPGPLNIPPARRGAPQPRTKAWAQGKVWKEGRSGGERRNLFQVPAQCPSPQSGLQTDGRIPVVPTQAPRQNLSCRSPSGCVPTEAAMSPEARALGVCVGPHLVLQAGNMRHC
ncbi:hypothetical protein HJG60_011310 [Phyllostomus discolor]|uniref:Uncharacterized protein n=1 Tax=Phyllostomus discolor TaxID=89673 RepID=A0A834A4C8_9CHIR|nr:hypothetical protein HJG60_011310 [Phyllostomus discolor]